MKSFRYEVVKSLNKWLNRRSQRRSYIWEGLIQMMRTRKLDDALIRVKKYEFCVYGLPEEPYVRPLYVRICGRGGQ